MAKNVKFNIKLQVDGKDVVVEEVEELLLGILKTMSQRFI